MVPSAGSELHATRIARHPPFIRTVAFGQLQDTFLVAAVTTILLIRLQLWATNYPKLGGGNLHIAHLLWGGLLMLIAIGLLLTVLGRRWRQPAAVVAGAGFGFFIDEVGKFVTSNNNYFFKPSAAIIYITFICLYLIARWLRERRSLSPAEYLANALDIYSDGAVRGLTTAEKEQSLRLLAKAQDHPLAAPLRGLVESTRQVPSPSRSFPTRVAADLRNGYEHVCDEIWFQRIVIGLFAAFAVFAAAAVLAIVIGLIAGALGLDINIDLKLTVAQGGEIGADIAATALVWTGIVRLLTHRKLAAYRLFEYALLVELFVGQTFSYIDKSFGATWGFLLCLGLLITLRYMIRQEVRLEHERGLTQGPTHVKLGHQRGAATGEGAQSA